MGVFSKNEPIIWKESDNARKHLAALESFRGSLPAAAEKQLEADIRAVKAGIAGEERILYELRNSHIDMYVLQDLFLEHEGLTAQIDFLVLTKQRFFVLECKNLYGNISVNERGDFIRTFGGRKREGIYSPLTQNQRHVELIRAMKRADRSVVMNILLDKDFDDLYRSFIVLANPKTVLDDRAAPEEVRSKIIRADQLVSTINAVNSERGPYRVKSPMSVIREAADWFLEKDLGEGDVDYAARYREMAKAATAAGPSFDAPGRVEPSLPAALPPEAPSVAVGEGLAVGYSGPGNPLCPKCGAPTVVRKAKRGKRAGKLFYGCSRWPNCYGGIDID